jgi:hypothetical protein
MHDITTAPYLFIAPGLATDEAKRLLAGIPSKALYRTCFYPTSPFLCTHHPRHLPCTLVCIGRISQGLYDRLSASDANTWKDGSLDIQAILHEEIQLMVIKAGVYMSVLRHALSGMKVKLPSTSQTFITADTSDRLGQASQKS